MRRYLRGEIYYANLDPVFGSEQSGFRPVLIIQNDIGNRYSPTVIVAPISSKPDVKAKLPTHCCLDLKNCLNEPSVVLLLSLIHISSPAPHLPPARSPSNRAGKRAASRLRIGR